MTRQDLFGDQEPKRKDGMANKSRVGPLEGARTVFICHAHESDEFKSNALHLAKVLITEGLQVHMDQLEEGPRRDWGHWALSQFRSCEFILPLASKTFRDVADGLVSGHRHAGLRSELTAFRTLYKRNPAWSTYVLPVILPGQSRIYIPLFLGPENEDYYEVVDYTPLGVKSLMVAIHGTEKRKWKLR